MHIYVLLLLLQVAYEAFMKTNPELEAFEAELKKYMAIETEVSNISMVYNIGKHTHQQIEHPPCCNLDLTLDTSGQNQGGIVTWHDDDVQFTQHCHTTTC